MTGYGRASGAVGEAKLTVEASTVNRRGFELNVSAPQEWSSGLERLVAGWGREAVSRGRLSLSFQLPQGRGSNAFTWDAAGMATSLQKLARQADSLGLPFAPGGDVLLRLAELHRTSQEGLPSLEDASVHKALQTIVKTALGQLVAMRETEGAFLKADLRMRLGLLEKLSLRIQALGKGETPRHRELLFSRLQQAGLSLDPTDERVLKEMALFADRCDISEETTRLHSHFAQFNACLDEGGEVGRKLDFLCQEIHREFNTIGSKACHVDITRCVIEGKNELERIREQVQNVE
jgi:uncharacterized protein (TIGR00255 family)